MYLKKLSGKNFRKFSELKFYFHPFLNLIFAENGKGKTTLLEAIYLLLTGSGFREKREVELLKFNAKEFWLQADFSGEAERVVKIIGKKENSGLKKTILIDKKPAKAFQLKKDLPWPILFTPEDLKIVAEDPETRRKYVDKLLSKLDPKYKSALLNYENALKRRNKIISQNKDGLGNLEEELKFWDQYLEQNSKTIIQQREKFFEFCNKNNSFEGIDFKIKYKPNPFTKEKSKELLKKELEVGYTLAGPHRDDFEILIKKGSEFYNLKSFGARSEQRLSILWLKNNEALFTKAFLEKKYQKNFRLIFLLDDVFSELDFKNREKVLKVVKNYQCFITTSYPEVSTTLSLPHHIISL